MSQGDGLIDTEVAAMLLGISTNAVRQLVYRGRLVPVGKERRRNTFRLQDVLALQTQRAHRNTSAL